MRRAWSPSKLLGVSYVPYDPDVYPPEPAMEGAVRPKRSWKWPIGILLYLLAIFGWVVWMKIPVKIQAPLAKADLFGSNELRLVHVHAGTTPGFRWNETFGNRIRMEPMRGNRSYGNREPGLWMVFSTFYPMHEDFAAPSISAARIIEPGSPYSLKAEMIKSDHGVFSVVYFPVVPRLLPSLNIEIAVDGKVVRMTVPNPAVQSHAAETPKPLPQQVPIKGGIITLESLKLQPSKDADFNLPTYNAWPRFRFDVSGVPTGGYATTYRWRDISGNVTGGGMLPFSEPVWHLDVDVEQTASFPFRTDQIDDLGTFVAPAPGEIRLLKVPPRLAKQVRNIVVFGQGEYDVSGTSVRAKMKNEKGKALPGPAVTLSSQLGSSQIRMQDWGVYQLARGEDQGKTAIKFQLRLRKGGQLLSHTSSGSKSSSYYSRESHQSGFRSADNATIQPGEEISIDVVYPESEAVSFSMSRPSLESFPKPSSESGRKK